MKQKSMKNRTTFESELSNALRIRSISHFLADISSIEIASISKKCDFYAILAGNFENVQTITPFRIKPKLPMGDMSVH